MCNFYATAVRNFTDIYGTRAAGVFSTKNPLQRWHNRFVIGSVNSKLFTGTKSKLLLIST